MGEDLKCLNLGTGLVPMQVFASESTCVLFTNNRLKCFGDNAKGQLGYGHTGVIGDQLGRWGTLWPLSTSRARLVLT